MKVELITAEDPRWPLLLERVRHDFYHLPAYARLSARVDGGEARAVLAEDGDYVMLLPVVVREIAAAAGAWDAASPYGYPGPLVDAHDGSSAGFVTEAYEAASDRLRELGCVSLFTRTHPLLGPTPRPRGATVVQHGETVVIDLDQSEDELWSGTRSGHRNEINRAVRAGHRASVDGNFQHLNRFLEIYRNTMSRVGAHDSYFFDGDYVAALHDALGDSLHLAVVEIEGTVAAAGLFVETCGIVQYHLSGTDSAYERQRPTKLLLHYVRSWAKARGNHLMHLGGGLGGAEDSLFGFKAGFSKARAPFHTVRMIVDPAAYESLCPAEALTGDHTFFPAYRAHPPNASSIVTSVIPLPSGAASPGIEQAGPPIRLHTAGRSEVPSSSSHRPSVHR